MIIMTIFTTTACANNEEKTLKTDAEKFEAEYEKLNGTKTQYGDQNYQNLKISSDNPFVYKKPSDIINLLEEKETFVVYFGFATCPWCRSVVPTLIDVASDLGIYEVYYVDVKDIRNILELDENGEVITTKEGTEDYHILLEELEPVLEAYTLIDSAGNERNTGQKRIYAPTIVSVVNGEVKEATDGVSTKQTDGFMDLTNEMLEESYDKIKCTIQCVADNKAVCSAKTKC